MPFAEARRQLFGIKTLQAPLRRRRSSSASACSRSPASRSSSSRTSSTSTSVGARRRDRGLRRSGSFAGLLHRASGRSPRGDCRATAGRLATLTGLILHAGRRRPAADGRVAVARACRIVFVFVANIGFSGYLPAYLTADRADRAAPGALAGLRLLADPRRPAAASLSAVILGNLGDSAGYRVAIAILSVIVAARRPGRHHRQRASSPATSPTPPSRSAPPATCKAAAGRRRRRPAHLPGRRGRLRPGAGAVRRRHGGAARARSSPCSAPTAPASRRC